MLMLPPSVRVFVCAEATDMRRSFDRLAEMVSVPPTPSSNSLKDR